MALQGEHALMQAEKEFPGAPLVAPATLHPARMFSPGSVRTKIISASVFHGLFSLFIVIQSPLE